ncbi:MAG: hypothetical protein H7A38_02030 [Chlamydiales bacterium]|nr:hypothetical protein [Chlamydiales bacterium]
MTSLLTGIQGTAVGTWNTVALSCSKFSTTPLWQKTGAVAMPYIRHGASYWPNALRFNPLTSVQFGAGIAVTILTGAAVSWMKGSKP